MRTLWLVVVMLLVAGCATDRSTKPASDSEPEDRYPGRFD
jgi:uncharacterized protein YceK